MSRKVKSASMSKIRRRQAVRGGIIERPVFLFGAAYYPEYNDFETLDSDLDLMLDAGFNVIRAGESVWSTWEPREGEFDTAWILPLLDAAHERGIHVLLGTPTYAVPMWLARRYPEIAGEPATGVRAHWGSRQEVNFNHAAFRFHAERVIVEIAKACANHPAVIGFQIDNEPGVMRLHNEDVFQGFVDSLRRKYVNIDRLNREWGLVYWSHQLTSWSDLWRPDGNQQPQYDLAWTTHLANLTSEFIAWQAGILLANAPGTVLTTSVAYDRATVDDYSTFRNLDVASGSVYYATQDALTVNNVLSDGRQGWTRSGAWNLFLNADMLYSAKNAPFWVTETNAGSIGGPATNFPPYPGQLGQAAWAFISKGAQMVEYWHWGTTTSGAESGCVGVIPSSGRPGRIYEEIHRIGADLAAADSWIGELGEPVGEVGLLYSRESRDCLRSQAPLAVPGTTGTWPENLDPRAYDRLFESLYLSVFGEKLSIRVVRSDYLETSLESFHGLQTLILVGAAVLSERQTAALVDYVRAGGHLVLGVCNEYLDSEGRSTVRGLPGSLLHMAGVEVEETATVSARIKVISASPRFCIGHGSSAQQVIECLVPRDAESLASYDHPYFGSYSAVTTQLIGSGRITCVGTVADGSMIKAIHDLSNPAIGVSPLVQIPKSVTVMSRRHESFGMVHFISNWGWEPKSVSLSEPSRGLLGGGMEGFIEGDQILGPWSTCVLTGANARSTSLDT